MLGDLLHDALDRIGITEERVSRWLGKCCCEERRQRLNALGNWARRVLAGRTEKAREHLETLLDSPTTRGE